MWKKSFKFCTLVFKSTKYLLKKAKFVKLFNRVPLEKQKYLHVEITPCNRNAASSKWLSNLNDW